MEAEELAAQPYEKHSLYKSIILYNKYQSVKN